MCEETDDGRKDEETEEVMGKRMVPFLEDVTALPSFVAVK